MITYWDKIRRKKVLPPKGLEDHTKLVRSLTAFDLIFYGVAAMSGGYIYGVSVVLVGTKSGAGSFISNIIAGSVAALNAQCYSELSSKVPFGGGGYSFTYMILGELFAFITGWAMLLEYLLGFAFASIGASNAINVLANHTIDNGILNVIGKLPDTNGYLTTTPNILAGCICIVIIFVLGMGAKISVGFNSAVTMFSTTILLIAAVYMAAHSNVSETLFPKSTNQTGNTNALMPFGISGIIGGAAVTFTSFSGFDAISLAGDIVINPKRTIPISINIAIATVFIINTFYYVCLSFYAPWQWVNPLQGLSGVFYKKHIVWLQILTSIGEITGYLASAFCNMFALSHIVYSLSNDGLILPAFRYVSKRFQVPIFTNIVFGIVAVLMTVLFDLQIIANFMSAGTLISYMLVSICVLILRLINVDKIEVSLPIDQVGPTFTLKELTFSNVVEKCCTNCPGFPKFSLLIGALISMIISAFIAALFGFKIDLSFPIIISVSSVFLVIMFCCIVILFLFKYYRSNKSFEVRPVPLFPILCVLCNVVLASQLDYKVWYRAGAWLLCGLLNYFIYGIRHSFIDNIDLENSLLIRKSISESLALTTQ